MPEWIKCPDGQFRRVTEIWAYGGVVWVWCGSASFSLTGPAAAALLKAVEAAAFDPAAYEEKPGQ